MFELYNYDKKIPKTKYDAIYKIIINNYFDRNKELISKRKEIDTKEAYNNWVNTILNTKDYNILLYYIDNSLAGFIAFMYTDKELCLSEVQLEKQYKNKGYLKNMLREVIKVSNKERYNMIYGTINKNNLLSKQVFTHIGFKNVYNNRYEISIDELNSWIND